MRTFYLPLFYIDHHGVEQGVSREIKAQKIEQKLWGSYTSLQDKLLDIDFVTKASRDAIDRVSAQAKDAYEAWKEEFCQIYSYTQTMIDDSERIRRFK